MKKELEEECVRQHIYMLKPIINTWITDKNKESSYLEYLDANNLYRYAMSQKLPIRNFKWINDLSIFTEDFIKIDG